MEILIENRRYKFRCWTATPSQPTQFGLNLKWQIFLWLWFFLFILICFFFSSFFLALQVVVGWLKWLKVWNATHFLETIKKKYFRPSIIFSVFFYAWYYQENTRNQNVLNKIEVLLGTSTDIP